MNEALTDRQSDRSCRTSLQGLTISHLAIPHENIIRKLDVNTLLPMTVQCLLRFKPVLWPCPDPSGSQDLLEKQNRAWGQVSVISLGRYTFCGCHLEVSLTSCGYRQVYTYWPEVLGVVRLSPYQPDHALHSVTIIKVITMQNLWPSLDWKVA